MGAAQLRATRAHVTNTSLLTTLALPRFWPPSYENTLISPSGYVLPSMISLLKLQYFLFFIFKCVLFLLVMQKNKILILNPKLYVFTCFKFSIYGNVTK